MEVINFLKIYFTTAVIILVLCFVGRGGSSELFATGSQDKSVAPIREALEKWVQVRKLISKERADWMHSKDLLESRTSLTMSEIESMKVKLSEMKSNQMTTSTKIAKLNDQKKSLIDLTTGISTDLDRLESAVAKVVPRLPRPLRERVDPLATRLRGNHPSKATGARVQAIIGILNEVNKFNNIISTGIEILDSADGRMVEMSTLYLGVGQGYYLTSDLRSSGKGYPGSDSWEWHTDPTIRDSMIKIFSILRNETSADYVLVPAIIK